MDKPKFQHDCDECIFVSTVGIGNKVVDFYRHPRTTTIEYVFRYGNDGPEYYSTTEVIG